MTELHAVLELFSFSFCIMLAFSAYRRLRELPSGFNMWLFWGFALTGCIDAIHGISAFLYSDLLAYWVPWTWALSRLILAFLLLIAVSFSQREVHISKMKILGPLSLALLLAVLILEVPHRFLDVSWVYLDGWIKRPLDFILIPIWGYVLYRFKSVEISRLQLPKKFYIFMYLGLSVHIIMAFGSSISLDFAFMLAHVVKVVEYGYWYYSIQQERQSGLWGWKVIKLNKVLSDKSHKDAERLKDLATEIKKWGGK